jgi:hypothetical protein
MRDWTTWVYLPLLLLLLVGLPLLAYRTYRHAHQDAALTRAVAEMREDFRTLLTLLEYGVPEEMAAMPFVEVEERAPRLGDEGLDIISDNRITDLREWFGQSAGGTRRIYIARHVLVRKTSTSAGLPGLRLQSLWDLPDLAIRCTNLELQPILRRCHQATKEESGGSYAWEILLDFSDVPVGETVEIEVTIGFQAPPDDERHDNKEWWHFEVDAEPEIATSWILLPNDRPQDGFSVIRWRNDTPTVIELVKPTHRTEMNDGSVINWSVVHPEPDYTYSTRWSWQ